MKITDVGAALDTQFERVSDTPRTDAHYKQIYDEGLGLEYCETAIRSWAEKLEGELAEAKAEVVRLKGEAESWEKVFDRTCEHLADAKAALAEANKALRIAVGLLSTYPKLSSEHPEYTLEYILNIAAMKGCGK